MVICVPDKQGGRIRCSFMEERWWFGSPQAFGQGWLGRWGRRRVVGNSTIHFSLDFCPFLECTTLELHGFRFILIFPFGKYCHRDPMGPKPAERVEVQRDWGLGAILPLRIFSSPVFREESFSSFLYLCGFNRTRGGREPELGF